MRAFPTPAETASADERAALQLTRLRDLVARLARSGAPYWEAKLGGVDPGDLRSVDDLRLLPATTKSEFRETYPFGMLAVPLTDTVRVHASSGTSGKPTIVAYTADDVDVFAEVNARAIACAGGRRDDVVQVAYGYGLFTGGLGLHYGAERLGATTVPASGGNVSLQLQLLADLGAAGIAATPSFTMLLAEHAATTAVDGPLRLRYGVLGAEPWSEGFRERLEAAWSELTGGPFDACDIYGLSEVIGPGVAMECRENRGGLHVFDDHFLPEVLDPDTGAPAVAGARGELVLTTLTKEALPVVRYRTGDVTQLLDGDCPCGRTHPRIARIEGRVDDMLVVRGVNVLPREIETVVLDEPAVTGNYAIVVDRRRTMPELEVRTEVASESDADRADEVADRIARRLEEVLRLRVTVVAGAPGSVPRPQTGKAKRVFERTEERDEFAER